MAKEETVTLTDKLDKDWKNVQNLVSQKVNSKDFNLFLLLVPTKGASYFCWCMRTFNEFLCIYFNSVFKCLQFEQT